MFSGIHDHSDFNPNGGSYLCRTDLAHAEHVFFFSRSSPDQEIETPFKESKERSFYLRICLDIRRVVDALAVVGAPISVEDHIVTILDGLPPDFDPFVSSILSRINPYKVAEIEALLLVQEERLERHHQLDPLSFPATTALSTWTPSNPTNDKANFKFHSNRGGRGFSRSQNFARGSRFSRSQARGSWTSSKPTCQVCGKYGHAALQCWQWYDHKPNPPPRANFSQYSILDPKPNDASLMGIPSATEDPLWYPDSGATHHVTKDPTFYSTKQPYHNTETIKMGNGSGLFIANTGSAIFRSSLTDKPFLLRNLLHVLMITKNLLSVSQFARDNHVYFQFHDNHC